MIWTFRTSRQIPLSWATISTTWSIRPGPSYRAASRQHVVGYPDSALSRSAPEPTTDRPHLRHRPAALPGCDPTSCRHSELVIDCRKPAVHGREPVIDRREPTIHRRELVVNSREPVIDFSPETADLLDNRLMVARGKIGRRTSLRLRLLHRQRSHERLEVGNPVLQRRWHTRPLPPKASPAVPVGVTGFEPATLRSQSGCATKLRYTPWPRGGTGCRRG
jgi:hypothetical protein